MVKIERVDVDGNRFTEAKARPVQINGTQLLTSGVNGEDDHEDDHRARILEKGLIWRDAKFYNEEKYDDNSTIVAIFTGEGALVCISSLEWGSVR